MKYINKYIAKVVSAIMIGSVAVSCADFEDINTNPTAVSEANVQVGHLLNRSVVEAQQNPHIAERIFVLSWLPASRYIRGGGLAVGSDNDGWNTDFYSAGYAVGWLNSVNSAINLAEKRIAENKATDVERNLLQMSRIWRAQLISTLSDCFGPIPVEVNFDGKSPEYKSVKDCYAFALKELKEAVAAIKTDVSMASISEDSNNSDQFFKGDMSQWVKYGNSLRLRLAMRLSNVEPEVAKAHFTELANAELMKDLADIAAVQEGGGWSSTTGVFTRPWNGIMLNNTLNNLFLGLGGVDFQLPKELEGKAKLHNPNEYMGQRLEENLTMATNDPSAGFLFDGLPSKIDPRATILFHIPGYNDVNKADGRFPTTVWGGFKESNKEAKVPNMKKDPKKDTISYDMNLTWNTWVGGNWDEKGKLSKDITHYMAIPWLSEQFRKNDKKHIWFAPWETYFLLAEAAEYGWISGSAKEYYETGVRLSFAYHGISNLVDAYLSSEDYNRVGTSVAFGHVAEAQTHKVKYIDGYTNEEKEIDYVYPKNSVYKNGTLNNDHLNKIITQKYIANCPYLPLEAWNDHRRLGLPFFENPAVETDFLTSNNQVPLTKTNYMETRWEFYPQRMRYPSNMEVNSKKSFDQAIQLLGGANKTSTPLYWSGAAKK